MSKDHVPGADDFLHVLVYVVIKASSHRLILLSYIQLYRRQAKLVSESAYYFTNLVSAKSFIVELDAKSLSIDESEFEENMKIANLKDSFSSDGTSAVPLHITITSHGARQNELLPTFDDIILVDHRDYGFSRGKGEMEVDTDGEF